MKAVLRYDLNLMSVAGMTVLLPRNALLLSVGVRPQDEASGVGSLWALVDTDMPTETREFLVKGTGHPFLDDGIVRPFLGRLDFPSMAQFYHVFVTPNGMERSNG